MSDPEPDLPTRVIKFPELGTLEMPPLPDITIPDFVAGILNHPDGPDAIGFWRNDAGQVICGSAAPPAGPPAAWAFGTDAFSAAERFYQRLGIDPLAAGTRQHETSKSVLQHAYEEARDAGADPAKVVAPDEPPMQRVYGQADGSTITVTDGDPSAVNALVRDGVASALRTFDSDVRAGHLDITVCGAEDRSMVEDTQGRTIWALNNGKLDRFDHTAEQVEMWPTVYPLVDDPGVSQQVASLVGLAVDSLNEVASAGSRIRVAVWLPRPGANELRVAAVAVEAAE